MGIVTALWLVPLVALVIAFGFLILLHRRAPVTTASAHPRYWISVLVLGGVVAIVRVGICWWVTYRAFIHQESVDEIPFIALLMPEYLIVPGDPASPEGMWALTAALVIGSFAAVVLMAWFVWRFALPVGPKRKA